MNEKLRNWAGNLSYRAARVLYPTSVEQVSEIVAGSKHIKALGTRHSFSDIADCGEDIVSLSKLDRVIGIHRRRQAVMVEAGVRYGQLGEYLHGEGYALANMASLPHISVAGAVATATHGSGLANGNLATSVVAIEMVSADGSVIELSRQRNGDEFDGMVVSLGAMGVVTKLTLKIEPTFDVKQTVYENLAWRELEKNLDEIFGSAYSVSLFTDWRQDAVNQVWLKRRVGAKDEGRTGGHFSANGGDAGFASSSGRPAQFTAGRSVSRSPWHERLPHFRMEYTPSSGEELQSEYFVPRRMRGRQLRRSRKLKDAIRPLLLISEIRTIAADGLWMSPCYQRDCVAIHFTWKADWPGVSRVLPRIESALRNSLRGRTGANCSRFPANSWRICMNG